MAPASAMAAFAAALLLAITAAPAAADPGTTSTVEPQTTAAATTTAEPPAPTAPTTATTSAGTTTTAPQTTTARTTSAATTTQATPSTTTSETSVSTSTAAEATSSRSLSFARSCPAAAVAVLLPGRLPILVGPVVSDPLGAAGLSRLAYPSDGSIVSGSRIGLDKRSCGNGRAQIASLSLFGDAVTADQVDLSTGKAPAARVAALSVDGKRVSTAGRRVQLGAWGYLEIGPGEPVRLSGGGVALSALAVHLLQPRAGLPAGAVVLVSVAGVPAQVTRRSGVAKKGHKHKRSSATHEPLKVTPPLGQRHYIFPVVGQSDYVDTY